MKLSELLTESAIRLNLDDLDKWRLIGFLTDALIESRQIDTSCRDVVHRALVVREQQMSTGMEQGIAIPHASADVVQRTAVALGISRAGVDFQAIDGRPTHLVMLLVNPKDTKTHIRTLAEIARLLSSTELRAALRDATSAAAALERIREAEAAIT